VGFTSGNQHFDGLHMHTLPVFLSEEGRSKSHHFSQDGKSLVNIIREQPPTVNAIRLLGDLLSQAQLIPQVFVEILICTICRNPLQVSLSIHV